MRSIKQKQGRDVPRQSATVQPRRGGSVEPTGNTRAERKQVSEGSAQREREFRQAGLGRWTGRRARERGERVVAEPSKMRAAVGASAFNSVESPPKYFRTTPAVFTHRCSFFMARIKFRCQLLKRDNFMRYAALNIAAGRLTGRRRGEGWGGCQWLRAGAFVCLTGLLHNPFPSRFHEIWQCVARCSLCACAADNPQTHVLEDTDTLTQVCTPHRGALRHRRATTCCGATVLACRYEQPSKQHKENLSFPQCE